MIFRSIKGCGRSTGEQRCIWAAMQVWRRLPEERRERVRALIGRIAVNGAEGRALYDVAVRGYAPAAASRRTGVSLARVYELRRAFYERCEL